MNFTNSSLEQNSYFPEWFGMLKNTNYSITTTILTEISEEQGEPAQRLNVLSIILLCILSCCLFCFFSIIIRTLCIECLISHDSWHTPSHLRRYQNYDSSSSEDEEEDGIISITIRQVVSLSSGQNTSKKNLKKQILEETPLDEIIIAHQEDNLNGPNISCSICLEEIDFSPEAEKKVKQLSCGHIYHLDCISQWYFGGVASVSNCPLCREKIDNVVIDMDAI